ncbi:hypothetical protein OTU49_004834 [Cherax quadricarinatus]|uniref:Ubiquitin-conjugating enzyme E2 J2 n=1 Tax=Cherax quadricarinatus TaxID=27406 RepID=A0AAW0XDH8_CHEQU
MAMNLDTATARLRGDYMHIKREPLPYITAEPLPSNILEWHYVIDGPKQSPYEGGCYHGKLVFPADYPFRPPSIYMITPSGRFKTNTRLCLSISDFHPDTWNPAWSVAAILTGLLSFMLEKSPTYGSIDTTDEEKREFAKKSLSFNLKDKIFIELFSDKAGVRHRTRTSKSKTHSKAKALASAAPRSSSPSQALNTCQKTQPPQPLKSSRTKK